MADTELKQISSGPADVIVEVEEQAPLSNDKDNEENTASDGDSSSNTNDNQAPQDSHRRKYRVDEIKKAIKKGNLGAMRDWLSSLPQGDERKDELNTVKYKYGFGRYGTVLHLAALSNQVAIAKELLQEGADPNIKESKGSNALHSSCYASHDVNNTEMVELLIERVCNIDETNQFGTTPLHYAAWRTHTTAVKMLLEKGADPNKKDKDGCNALHLVCNASSDANITEVVELLIESNCRVNEQGSFGQTPLHYAAQSNLLEAVRLLLKNGADVELQVIWGDQPIHEAASRGNNQVIDVLIVKHVKDDSEVLNIALKGGYEYLVKQLIKTPIWPALMRRTFTISDKITTPFREMVKKMPDVAEEILNKCTINDPFYPNPDDEDYRVAFCYEFLEDAKDKEQRTSLLEAMRICLKNEADVELKHGESDQPIHIAADKGNNDNEERNKDGQCEFGYKSIVFDDNHDRKDRQNYSTSWGPKGFERETHPLAIMVQYKRLNLLNHPLVGSLLHHKWNKFGLLWYIINLLTYLVFLVSLTTFTLIIENPKSQACLSVSVNMSSNYSENYCGISTSRISFIYISALVVIILSLCRLVLEVLQFKIQLLRYLYDWNNWMETALYIFSIIFVFVFRNDCLCPLTWQWQIGVVAVFLGWINLVVFISKFPSLGIYVLMFINIFKTFLKTLLLSILLIVSFGLTFYLTFTQPEILRSPFSTPARSMLKIVTMTTGELDFDSIFRQDPAGGSDDAEEVPFPPISYMLWIVFIIIMPVLLNNMLVGLAVGDIGAIQNDAELEKLTLQVEHVLNVEEFLPDKWRRHFTCGYKEVEPNTKYYSFSSVKETWQEYASWGIRWKISKSLSHLKNIFKKKCRFFLWGGKRYDTRESIGKVLHPKEDEIKKNTHKLLHEVKDLKTTVNDKVIHQVDDLKTFVNDESEKVEQLLRHQVEDMKSFVNDENEKLQRKNDELLCEVEHLKTIVNDKVIHQVDDLKTSVDDMKQWLKQIMVKLESTEAK